MRAVELVRKIVRVMWRGLVVAGMVLMRCKHVRKMEVPPMKFVTNALVSLWWVEDLLHRLLEVVMEAMVIEEVVEVMALKPKQELTMAAVEVVRNMVRSLTFCSSVAG